MNFSIFARGMRTDNQSVYHIVISISQRESSCSAYVGSMDMGHSGLTDKFHSVSVTPTAQIDAMCCQHRPHSVYTVGTSVAKQVDVDDGFGSISLSVCMSICMIVPPFPAES